MAADIVVGLQLILDVILAVDVHGVIMLISIIEIISNLFVFYAHYKQSAVYYIPYFVVSVGNLIDIILTINISGNYITRWNHY